MFLHCINKQFLELGRAFRVLGAPADNPAAKDVQDAIEIEVGSIHRSHQLYNVPRPNLIGRSRQQFRLCIDGMCALSAALDNFALDRQ